MTLFLIILLLAVMVPLVAVILDSQVGKALASRIEGQRPETAADRRLATLENEVDRLSKEVQRLDDESAFLHKLLEEKRAPQQLPPPSERND
jgi:cell division protein FtsB